MHGGYQPSRDESIIDALVTTVESFASAAEADVAYETRELAALKSGNIITRIRFIDE